MAVDVTDNYNTASEMEEQMEEEPTQPGILPSLSRAVI